MDLIYTLIVLFIVGGSVWLFMKLLSALLSIFRVLGAPPKPGQRQRRRRRQSTNQDEIDGMNYGDFYNGPGGYDATGGYSDRHH